ncbi:MAG TPA: alpha/beta fold hydrolase [Gemmatimonadales bacterium]|nr:alpha/beta fold hydrolase [Gemmatimonadales bacterium]
MARDRSSRSRREAARTSKAGARARASAAADQLERITTEHRIPSGPVRLSVREAGAGKAMLLAHGMWCAGHMFDPMVAELAATHRVIIPDLRAHGRSAVPRSAWDLTDIADDYVRILDALGVDRVILGGFSMGGMAAVHFALNHPDRLAALILISTSGSAEPWVRRREIDALSAIVAVAGAPHWLSLQAAFGVFTREFRHNSPELVDQWTDQVEAMSRKALVQSLHAVSNRPSLEDRLGEITAPTLVLAGHRDWQLSTSHSVVLSKKIPGAELAILPGVGHGLPMERPAETVRLMLRFLDQAGPGPSGPPG